MFKSALETHLSVDGTTQQHPCHRTPKEVFLIPSAGTHLYFPKVPPLPSCRISLLSLRHDSASLRDPLTDGFGVNLTAAG